MLNCTDCKSYAEQVNALHAEIARLKNLVDKRTEELRIVSENWDRLKKKVEELERPRSDGS